MKIPKARHVVGVVLFILVWCLATPVPGRAEGPARFTVDTAVSQRLSVTVGKSVIVQSKAIIKRVSTASPEIADALVLTPWQIYIMGKSSGITSVTLWSDQGREVVDVFDIEVLPDTVRLKEKINAVFPGEDVRITADNDAVTLSGTVSSTAVMSRMLAVAQAYAPKDKDGKYRLNNFLEVGGVHQVMLEVRVSEMARSTMKRLGFNWNYISDGGRTFGMSLLNNLTTTAESSASAIDFLYTDPINMIFRFMGAGATWTVFIDALKENGLTKVLAEPTLITLSGRPATFLAGGEFPVPVPDDEGTISIEYKPFGVGLKFTPTVLSTGKISMEVAPEVSELDYTNALTYYGFVVPGLRVRRVATVVELADGQSFAVAGLLKDDVREVVTKFPLLGDIPVLGALFRSTSFQKNESELVIIVTAHLVKPLDMKKQTLPTDQYVEPDDFDFYLLGNIEGRGEPPERAPGQSSLNKGGGLEGEFGHITP